MNTKLLICIASLWLILGFNHLASATPVNDTGDTLYPGYGIDTADVAVFPYTTDIEDYLSVVIDMDVNLPGIVVVEFDVDNNPDTGGNNVMGIYLACGSSTKLKEERGFDIAITLVLRDQGSDAPTALCKNCYSPPSGSQCAARGNYFEGDCYWLAGPCTEENCYKIILPNCCPPGCAAFNGPCTGIQNPCGAGRLYAEWYATTPAIPQALPADRGRIDMQPVKGTNEGDKDQYFFPWKRIVYNAYNFLLADTECPPELKFDIEDAKDAANLRWQVSAWVDPDFETTQNDFLNMTDMCAEVSDVAPNMGKGAATTCSRYCCFGDFDGDYDVDGTDAFTFKKEFFKCNLGMCPLVLYGGKGDEGGE